MADTGTAITRAFQVLEHFRRVRTPARLKDVVAALGYPTSTTADLLKEMAECGYLAFHTGSRTYFPTPAVSALGDWIRGASNGHAAALAMARRLNDDTGELIFVGTENGLHVQYIEALRSRHPVQYVVEAGVRRLLVKSGLGWALLAQEDDGRIEQVYRRTLATAQGRADQPPTLLELRAQVALVRRDGYAFSRNLLYKGASVLAAAIPIASRGRRFALGIAGPTDRIEDHLKAYATALRRAAQDAQTRPSGG